MSSVWDELKELLEDVSDVTDEMKRLQQKSNDLDNEIYSAIEVLDKTDINDPDDVAESIKEVISILSEVKKELY